MQARVFHRITAGLDRASLPGPKAQLRMAPSIRAEEMASARGVSIRQAAILLLFFRGEDDQVQLTFIRRAEYDGVHSGQIAFPGGKQEESDTDLLQTALRESGEEIGIDPAKVSIFGRLTDLYIPPSRFNVRPFLGYMDAAPSFTPDPMEVAEVLTTPLASLLNPENEGLLEVTSIRYGTLLVPCYAVNGHKVWGATAMVLSEALELFTKAAEI